MNCQAWIEEQPTGKLGIANEEGGEATQQISNSVCNYARHEYIVYRHPSQHSCLRSTFDGLWMVGAEGISISRDRNNDHPNSPAVRAARNPAASNYSRM
jgi:hypothetical protein